MCLSSFAGGDGNYDLEVTVVVKDKSGKPVNNKTVELEDLSGDEKR